MRLDDWRSRLRSYLADANKPFVYGERDCYLHAANAIHAMTGEDPAAAYRGCYSTHIGAMRLARKEGFDDHVAWAWAHYDETPVLMAREGDLAVVDGDGGESLGVVTGSDIAVMTPAGLGRVPLTQAKTAFRV